MILKIKINNALYAMGIRNYASWRVSKYLQFASMGDIDFVEKIIEETSQHLAAYTALANTPAHQEWAQKMTESIDEMASMGDKLIEVIDSEGVDEQKVNKLIMVFQERIHKMDELLMDTISKANLKDIERQLHAANVQKEISILILIVSLAASLLLGLMISVVVYKGLRRERQRREFLVQKMIRMEEEERKNLSRQVHDQLSQDLSALKIHLELIGKDIDPQQRTEQKDRIEKSRKVLVRLIDKGHNISELLRPPELDDLGLVESLDELVLEHQEITGGEYTYNRPDQDLLLPPEQSLTLYRIVQEAFTNIAKYAQATHVIVDLQVKGEHIQLTVEDDGEGFDYKKYTKRPKRRREDTVQLGLQGLRERVELLGGKLTIKTAPKKGTKLIAELPMGAPEGDRRY